MNARMSKEIKGFTTVLLRISSPLPPKKATPPGRGINAPVTLLIDRIRADRHRESLKENQPALT